ncbi:unnamed protein product [Spodoptera littoralis]|uniref:Peptidase S1 domain-containing protein n=1 Tax=Spodoptera littoralis TaxID=7109 RepID=A0A9P0IA22_SPOLI|nr:unnamed protein product [Spodoptera littoralis]CAH1642463.1 unnamed protein product [Spodoptera littoralis]
MSICVTVEMFMFHVYILFTLVFISVCGNKTILQYFGSLDDYQVNATETSESKYPWIARVIHSRSSYVPHMCTAACIDEAIFVTAARCIYNLKVNYTRILYNSKFYDALAFVVPSVPTKQSYDDIGFIVVRSKNSKKWPVIKPFNGANRTDKAFDWFKKLEHASMKYKIVGYAMRKWLHRISVPERQYDLSELDVIVSLDICTKLLTNNGKDKIFRVPCYHSCTFQEFKKKNSKCQKYHGVEGGALIDTTSNKLVGIATWTISYSKYEVPVGFSVLNSKNFFDDFRCAKRIRNDNGLLIVKGYYQSLC